MYVHSHPPQPYSNAASATKPTINEPPTTFPLLVAAFFDPSPVVVEPELPELPDPPDDEVPEEEPPDREIPAAVQPSRKATTRLGLVPSPWK